MAAAAIPSGPSKAIRTVRAALGRRRSRAQECDLIAVRNQSSWQDLQKTLLGCAIIKEVPPVSFMYAVVVVRIQA
jgi:hypothetical protein